LEPEQPEDMEDNEEKICSDQGINLVEIEYNNENRDASSSDESGSKRRWRELFPIVGKFYFLNFLPHVSLYFILESILSSSRVSYLGASFF